jgi:hypothetical protein
MMCARTEEEATARGLEGANFFGYSLAHFYVFGDHVPGRTNVWEEFEERRGKMGYSPEAALAAKSETLGAKAAAGDQTGLRGAVGTPDQLREFLRRYEAAGVDQLIFVMQAGKNRHEHIMESIELFGTEVLPEFAERDQAQSAAKAEHWAPIVEEALARRPDSTVPMPKNYVMKALPKQMVDATRDQGAQQWLDDLADKQAAGTIDEEFQRLIDS